MIPEDRDDAGSHRYRVGIDTTRFFAASRVQLGPGALRDQVPLHLR